MSSQLDTLRNSYAAALLASVSYGFYVLLAGITLHALLKKGASRKAHRKALIIYTSVMFAVQTIYYCGASKWSEIEFIESEDAAGSAVFATELFNNLSILKDTMYTINIWLADGFIVWRAFIVCNGRPLELALPILLYLGSIATGIGLLVESAIPGAMFGQVSIINFGTPFWSLSVATNVLTTCIIAARLLYRRGALRRFAGPDASPWSSEVVILAESATLYAITALIYIPLFARNSAVQFPFSALLVTAACIATNLIVLRMAQGVAITRDWMEMELTARPSGGAAADGTPRASTAHSGKEDA